MLNRYSASYPSLKPRVLKTLLRALVEDSKQLGSRFGAICGLTAMGKEVVRSTLGVPANLKALGTLLTASRMSEEADQEAEECIHRVLVSCAL